jgi:hypothetical protein
MRDWLVAALETISLFGICSSVRSNRPFERPGMKACADIVPRVPAAQPQVVGRQDSRPRVSPNRRVTHEHA